MSSTPDADTLDEAMSALRAEYDADAVHATLDRIDPAHEMDRLEGRGGGLRSSKPQAQGDTGLTQYLWRHARFHSGRDTSMPVTASWWLDEWLEAEGIDASVSGILDEDGKAITSALDDLIAIILIHGFGLRPDGAARRWKGLLY